jgi:hypothetical protein
VAVYRVLKGQLIQEDEFRGKGVDLVRKMQTASTGADPGPSITLDNDMEFEVEIAPSDAAHSETFTLIKFGEWVQSEELNFGLAGTAPADAGFRVTARGTAGFENRRFEAGTGLIGPDDRAYTGDDPYVVIALDGPCAPDLADFTASIAGAGLMQRFQMSQSGQSGTTDGIPDLTTIISDVKFRDEAITLKQKMRDMSPADRAKAQPQLDALIKNIVKCELRL